MRVNPATVILKALQEGPRDWLGVRFVLSLTMCRDLRKRRIDGLLDRALCHLTRSKQVRRMPDGRYEFRERKRSLWPGRLLCPGEINIYLPEGTVSVPVHSGDDSADVAGRIHEALREVNPGNVFCPPEYRR